MPVRFQHADDTAIRQEFGRHRAVLEKQEPSGETTIQCVCGLTATMPKGESALAAWVEHWLTALKGSAA